MVVEEAVTHRGVLLGEDTVLHEEALKECVDLRRLDGMVEEEGLRRLDLHRVPEASAVPHLDTTMVTIIKARHLEHPFHMAHPLHRNHP